MVGAGAIRLHYMRALCWRSYAV